MEDHLDFDLSPLQFMQKCFPDDFKEIEDARRAIGVYGLTGKQQVSIAIVIYIWNLAIDKSRGLSSRLRGTPF